jgi:hypothetical protein
VAGLPAGATANFASAAIAAGGSTTITVNSGTAAVGTYSLTVSAVGTSATHSTALTLVVASPPHFAIAVNPTSLTVVQGASGSIAITSTVVSGSAQSVTLAVSGLPTGASATFSPSTITAGAGATLAISAGTAVPGNYTLSVIANITQEPMDNTVRRYPFLDCAGELAASLVSERSSIISIASASRGRAPASRGFGIDPV